jgi:ribosomal protein S27E
MWVIYLDAAQKKITVKSKEGVVQGGASSSLLFSCVFSAYIEFIREQYEPLGVKISTIIDGIFIFGPAAAAIRCFNDCGETLASRHLYRNMKKAEIFILTEDERARQQVIDLLPVNHENKVSMKIIPFEPPKRGTIIAGVPVGHDEFINHFLEEKARELLCAMQFALNASNHGSVLGPQSHPVGSRQTACHALIQVIPAKMTFYMRTVKPVLTIPICNRIQTALRDCWLCIATHINLQNVDYDDPHIDRELAGMLFNTLQPHLLTGPQLQYIAALKLTGKLVKRIIPDFGSNPPESYAETLEQLGSRVKRNYEGSNASGTQTDEPLFPGILNTSVEQFIATSERGWAKDRTEVLKKDRENYYINELRNGLDTPENKARLHHFLSCVLGSYHCSVQQPSHSTLIHVWILHHFLSVRKDRHWFHASPFGIFTSFTDVEWANTVKLLFRLPIRNPETEFAHHKCKKCGQNQDPFAHHAFLCRGILSGCRTFTHNKINSTYNDTIGIYTSNARHPAYDRLKQILEPNVNSFYASSLVTNLAAPTVHSARGPNLSLDRGDLAIIDKRNPMNSRMIDFTTTFGAPGGKYGEEVSFNHFKEGYATKRPNAAEHNKANQYSKRFTIGPDGNQNPVMPAAIDTFGVFGKGFQDVIHYTANLICPNVNELQSGARLPPGSLSIVTKRLRENSQVALFKGNSRNIETWLRLCCRASHRIPPNWNGNRLHSRK